MPSHLRRGWRAQPALLGLLVLAPGIGLISLPAHAHTRGLYATKQEAELRAAELKCKGTFQMGTLWMPCANERALHKALQKAP
jgi:hypothetical protein